MVEGEDGQVATALGHLRILIFVSQGIACYLAALACAGRGFGPLTLALILLASLPSFVLAAATSSRGAMLGLMLAIGSAIYYGKQLTARRLIYGVVVLFGLAGIMGELRGREQGTLAESNTTFFDHVIGPGNFVTLERTTGIMTQMPSRVDYRLGETYLAFFTAFVPRTVWPNKPELSVGPWVRQTIYGVRTSVNGWPPNVFAEGYINFGILGMLGAGVIYGISTEVGLLAWLQREEFFARRFDALQYDIVASGVHDAESFAGTRVSGDAPACVGGCRGVGNRSRSAADYTRLG